MTASMAPSLDQPPPRVYSKVNDGERTLTSACCHELPWLPLRLHLVAPSAPTTASVPTDVPYRWYSKETVPTTKFADAHAEPS